MDPVFLITLGSLAIAKSIEQTDFSSVISDPGRLGNREAREGTSHSEL